MKQTGHPFVILPAGDGFWATEDPGRRETELEAVKLLEDLEAVEWLTDETGTVYVESKTGTTGKL